MSISSVQHAFSQAPNMRGGDHLSDGDQLRLDLFSDSPWDGRSPRVLTRGHLAVIFKAKAGESTSAFLDPRQVDMWPSRPAHREKSRRSEAPAAPLLLEPRGRSES